MIRISRYLVALFELNLVTHPSLASDCKNALSHFKRLYFSTVDGKHPASEELKAGKKKIQEIYLSSPLFQNQLALFTEERGGEITIRSREGTFTVENSEFETVLSKLKEFRKGEEWDFSFYPKESITFLLSFLTLGLPNQHLPESLLSKDTLLWTYSLANELKLTKLKRYVHYQLRLRFTKDDLGVDEFLNYYHQLQAFQEDFPKADFPLQFAYDHILLGEPWTLQFSERGQELYTIAEKWAGLGYTRAQFLLGILLHMGVGGEKDEEKAISLFELASNQGYAPAQYALGRCYSTGKRVKQDLKKASNLYVLAAIQRYAPAQFNLSRCFSKELGVVKDEEMAVNYLTLAARQFFIPAIMQQAEDYFFGIGVEKNLRTAFILFKKAGDIGSITAKSYLGVYYVVGGYVNRDFQKAVKLFQNGVDNGDSVGQHHLGISYLYGRGVEKNFKKALEWFKRAADSGLKYSRNELILCYDNGIGVPTDFAKAADLYKRVNDPANTLPLWKNNDFLLPNQ